MKHCPRCRQTYTDETLKFCRVDGTLLQTGPLLPESSDTLILPAARTNVAEPTQLLQSETAQPEETPSSIEAPRNSQAGNLTAASKNERLRRSVVIAVSVLILAATGFGFWLLKNRSSSGSSDSAPIESIAIEHYSQAVRADPNYAIAYSGLADAYTILQGYDKSVSPIAGRPALSAFAGESRFSTLIFTKIDRFPNL